MKPRGGVVGMPARVSDGHVAILPDNRHELWHLNPRGDVDACFFDLLSPVKLEHVQAKARQTWDGWVAMKGREGQVATTQPRIKGPFLIPSYDELDMRRYYMMCRWKRTSPLLLSIDDAAVYAMTEGPDPEVMYDQFLANLHNLTVADRNQIEREALANLELGKVAAQDALARERFQQRFDMAVRERFSRRPKRS